MGEHREADCLTCGVNPGSDESRIPRSSEATHEVYSTCRHPVDREIVGPWSKCGACGLALPREQGSADDQFVEVRGMLGRLPTDRLAALAEMRALFCFECGFQACNCAGRGTGEATSVCHESDGKRRPMCGAPTNVEYWVTARREDVTCPQCIADRLVEENAPPRGERRPIERRPSEAQPSIEEQRPRLTHVAVRHKGVVWSLPEPFRHHHIFSIMNYLGVEGPFDGDIRDDQGFLDASGRYLNRRQALPSALLHDQIKNDGKLIGSVLTSEDLW